MPFSMGTVDVPREELNVPHRQSIIVREQIGMKTLHKTVSTTASIMVIVVQFILVASLAVHPVGAAKTFAVPDEYPTIAAAIAAASPGDTVLVKPGIYYEDLTIDKALTVKSETPQAAVVVGTGGVAKGGKGVFTVQADNVAIEGFTIQSLNYTTSSDCATGIMLNADGATITGNVFLGPYYGVFASVTSQTNVSDNQLVKIGKNGIKICGGDHNVITGNVMTGNVQSGAAVDGSSTIVANNLFEANGLGLGLGASYSVIYGNNFTANTGSGIYFGASNTIVAANSFNQNKRGIDFSSDFAAPGGNVLYLNNFLNNTFQITSRSSGFSQTWDNGKEGNYWSTYTGVDANGDGIGDSAYEIFGDNIDHLPIMTQFTAAAGIMPSLPSVPAPITGLVAKWHFDETTTDGSTADSVDNNTVILAGDNPTSMIVQGKEGNAAHFNGTSYGFANPSTTLNISNELTIDAWVNVQEFKNVEYNNIFVECVRTTATYPARVWGFAINGAAPQSSSQPIVGALRGFFLNKDGSFNEIDTVQPVPLNQWIHVVFTRSSSGGMKIYVNDVSQEVTVLYGVQNPTGTVAKGTECYVGHDSISTIDELSISNTAWVPAAQPTAEPTPQPSTQPLWSEWWFWAAIATAFAVFGAALLLSKKSAAKPTA